MSSKLTKEAIIELGFEEVRSFNLIHSFVLELGRKRYLNLSNFDNCNCMLYLVERITETSKEVDGLICIHNYDYEKELTLEKLKLIISIFKS